MPVAADMLAKLAAKTAELTETSHLIENLEERLSALKRTKYAIEHEQLPELMMEAGVDKVGIPPVGNEPGYDLKLSPFYDANIAAGWEEERRQKAFAYLESVKAGDLIKTQIIISLPREQRANAKQLLKQLAEWSPDVKEAVHPSTLKSWLKEKSEAGDDVNLEAIGGTVGQVVKPKPRKKD